MNASTENIQTTHIPNQRKRFADNPNQQVSEVATIRAQSVEDTRIMAERSLRILAKGWEKKQSVSHGEKNSSLTFYPYTIHVGRVYLPTFFVDFLW